MAQDLKSRMMGAAVLNIDTYEEVEHDESATTQAALVVFIVAVCKTLGTWSGGPVAAVIAGVVAFGAWLVWAGVTFVVGEKVFGGEATWGEVLRTLGFAQAAGVLYLLGIVPLFGWIVSPVVSIWILVAGFIAIRQALDIGNGKTFLTILIGGLIYGALQNLSFFPF